MRRHRLQQFPGCVIENGDIAFRIGIAGIFLPEHLDHHVVGRLVDDRDHDLLAVDQEIAVFILGHGRLGDFKHVIPGQDIRHFIAQGFDIIPVDIDRFGGTHVRQRIMGAVDHALLQELRDDLILAGAVKLQLRTAQTVFLIREQFIQRHHDIRAGHVGRNVIRIGNAYIRGCAGGDVGDDIVVDPPVVGIQAHVHRDIRIEFLKVRNGLFINGGLAFVGIILGPERDFICLCFIKFFRDDKGVHSPGAMAPAQGRQTEAHQGRSKFLHHAPLVPPLDTLAMIFLWKIRKRIISGTEITTTAAIIAGMFSRPKPFSRISWMPLDTRK